MAIKEIKKSLPVRLTDAERLAHASEMGKESQLHAEARERKKEVVAQLTAEVEAHRTAVERLGTLLANGYEYRQVLCSKNIDLRAGKVVITRMDTGEVVEDRPLFPDEEQGELGV